MNFIKEFFIKEKNFFKGSGFCLISCYLMLFVNRIFVNYKIISKDCVLIILLIGFSINFYAIGFKFLFKKEK